MKQPADAYQHYRDKAREIANANYTSRRRERIPVPDDIDPWSIPLDELNVANPELFKAERVHPYFARLRKEAPVHYCEASQYGPYWSITRFADILQVDRDHQRFSSDARQGGVLISSKPQNDGNLPAFIQMDSPQHDEQRAAVAPMFAPTSLAQLRETIRERAVSILEELPRNEPFDWVYAVSKNLTGQMLATLLGVPVDMRYRLIDWSDVLSNPDNPEIVKSPADFFNTMAEVGEYFLTLWNEREGQADPGSDLISMMANDGRTASMNPHQFIGNLTLLITGGNDTTRNSISGGLLAMNQFPDQWAKLRSKPELVGNMVPEIIRWQTPLAHMARTATQDLTMHGQQIREGDRVIMWYLSGNRDEEVIDSPHEFRIDRNNARHHLSFGFGIHRCLGNRLAEMQLRILWEEILKRFDRIELVEEPERISSCMFHGYSRMMVCIPG